MHPLMQEHLDGTTPRTPRGPAPPWAVSPLDPPVDRTATGATPPRSPTPPRLTPPGLPDDDVRSAANILSLTAVLDAKFVQELFGAVHSGNTSTLAVLLHRANTQALSLVCRGADPMGGGGGGLVPPFLPPSPPPRDDAAAVDRSEQAAELVAAFLSRARAPAPAAVNGATRGMMLPRETLLGAAAALGRAEAVRLLLGARADPRTRDDRGCCALHRAAESGNLLTALLVLDRLQANLRLVSLAELTNADGETPEMFAALAGASEICRAFEVFSNMQNDAELRQLGSSLSSPDLLGGHRGVGTGNALVFMDLLAEAHSPAGLAASALLRRSTMGCSLVHSLSRRIPEDEAMLQQLIQQVCQGIAAAEESLLGGTWNSADPGLDPTLRSFATTAELRSSWQRLRTGAMKTSSMRDLEDFWQTHLTAETMISTLQNAVGDTFQLLLTVLWLYTREAWLRHILDSLAAALHAARMVQGNASSSAAEGATGATPLWRSDLPSTLQPIAPLVDALAPCMQLVQSALCWFEEAGIRHTNVTYRPLSLPMLGLQRLIDRHAKLSRRGEVPQGAEPCCGEPGPLPGPAKLGSGTWVALGAGSFFSSMSSRSDAIKRLSRTRCNVLLVIRPDTLDPCYPKHMSLRGSSVDDTLFPIQALFRITQITRSVSSDLDPEICSQGANSRWPVMIVELHATCRHLESLELLERRGNLSAGELEVCSREWMADAPPDEEHERLLAVGEMLSRFSASSAAGPSTSRCNTGRAEVAAQLLEQYAQFAEGSGDPVGAAYALIVKARCGIADSTVDGKRALGLLVDKLGPKHPEIVAARSAWRELGAAV